MHALVEEAEIIHIFDKTVMDYDKGENIKIMKPKLLKSNEEARVVIKMKNSICLEKFVNLP